MAPNNSVKILEVFRVSPPPTSPDSASPSSLPLTLFDIFWLRFPPVQRVFFYEISPTNAPFLHSILPKLKHSLSLALQHYHPLAGTLTWPKDSHKPIINFIEGDSVSFTLAESSADFYHLSGNNCFVEAEEYHSLVPHLPTSHEQATVLSLQVTIFSNCGFCIGISAHHAVLDGKSSTMFMKSWAHLCKHGGDGLSMVPELTPSYDKTVIKDPAGLEGIFLNQWMNHGGPNNKSLKVWEVKAPLDVVRGTFELSLAKIQKLRQLIITTALEEKNEQKQPLLQLSTYTITCAYTWVCLAKAEGVRDAKFLLGINVNARRRMEAPLPATYFGNCIGSRASIAERNELLGEEGVAVAVKAIGEAITSLDDGVLIGAENWLPKVFAATTDGPRFVGIAGSPRFELYNTDFGWGRPRKVEMISIDGTGAMCLSDSREGGGGIEIGLVLKKQEMEVFASLFSRGLEAL